MKPKSDLSSTTKYDQIMINSFGSPKAAAKHELLLNKPASEDDLLNI
jgi:hypothetical protein